MHLQTTSISRVSLIHALLLRFPVGLNLKMTDIKDVSNETRRTNWYMVLKMLYVHATALLGCFYIPLCKWQTLIYALMLFTWSMIGVTAGVHRLWAHRSYKAHWTLRTFLMLLNSIAVQGSIYSWVRDHRTHHKFSETDADPHNVRN